MAPLYPHIRMFSSFLQWKEQNKFNLSFCNGLSKFIFFTLRLEFRSRQERQYIALPLTQRMSEFNLQRRQLERNHHVQCRLKYQLIRRFQSSLVGLGGVKNIKSTLPPMYFFQFLSHISEFSSVKSFITLFITERGSGRRSFVFV